MVLPWKMPQKHGITKTIAKKPWYYHSKCPKNGFTMVNVQKHGITVMHALKKHGNTMVPFQIQFKMGVQA